MPNATEWADALRAAGVTVVEHAGWTARNTGGTWAPLGTIFHHTASNRNGGPAPALQLCIDNILCQAVIGRDGVWHLIAWGRASHAGFGLPQVLARTRTGQPPLGDARDVYGATSSTLLGNGYYLGIECENDGIGEPWPAAQLDAIRRGVAATHRLFGWPPETFIAHREWTARKIDPTGIDMAHERRLLARALVVQEDPEVTPEECRKIIRDEVPGLVRRVVREEITTVVSDLKDWMLRKGNAAQAPFRDLLVRTSERGSARAIKAEFRSEDGTRAANED
jgi:hypothetical protein